MCIRDRSNQDDSDNTFTMAAHTLSKNYWTGWHLFGTPLNSNAETMEDFMVSVGEFGVDGIAFNGSGSYQNLEKTLGEGFYLALNDNTTIKIGELKILSIHTPGHYFDSICYLVENVLFTGDTLFVGRTGRTISDGSNIEDLYESVYNKLLKLPGDTHIYPGHDYGEVPSISLKENKKISDLLQAENKEEFINKMIHYEKNRKIGS